MAITTITGLKTGLRPARTTLKPGSTTTTEGAGTFHSTWKSTPGAGANPPAYTAGTGYECTNSTTGAMPAVYSTDNNTYLSFLSSAYLFADHPILCDRLWACSGFDTTVITEQSVTTPGTIPARDVNGAVTGDGVLAFFEIYTAPGATAATWTLNYTNQSGVSGRIGTYTHPANAETAGQLCPVTLQSGDTGIRAVKSFTADISSGTAGDVGITLLRPIVDVIGVCAPLAFEQNAFSLAFPRLYSDTCLFRIAHCQTTAISTTPLTYRMAFG